MLVFCVITAVIGSFIYTVIKIKIEEWLEESRMSKLSLKKHHLSKEKSQNSSMMAFLTTKSAKQTVEISSDESDIVEVNGTLDSGEHSGTLNLKKDYDEDTLFKFQKSTDSIQSDENIEPVFQSGATSKSKTSLFSWNQKNIVGNKDVMILDDTDSSDDFCDKPKDQKPKRFYSNQRKRKQESSEDNLPTNKIESEDTPAEVAIHHERMISGVRVKLPVKPYSSQIAVMSKLIQGCTKSENCLLESPTGSGKTLALLCGVLAWHDHYTDQVLQEFNAKQRGGDCELSKGTKACGNDAKSCCNDFKGDCAAEYDDSYGEDFEEAYNSAKTKRTKIPKIYYGTRTHKQIEQVIRELRKTVYKNKKMTILSSREHTCIQDTTRNKTDLCNELLDPAKHNKCPYYNESNKRALATFNAIESRGLGSAWDIEELVTIGRFEGLCPYFAARNLVEQADIIFCPYNYIIDPNIRDSMQLDLKDQVIILDEAHNIEDICREVASVNFREDHLVAAANECESLMKQKYSDPETYRVLKEYLLKLVQFQKTIDVTRIHSTSDNLSSPYWTGAELLELFNMHNLGESTYSAFLAASQAAIADSNKAKEDNRTMPHQRTTQPIITLSTQTIIEQLMYAMHMITSETHMNDYRACIIETTVKDFKYATEDTWHSVKKFENRARTLKLLCMNPGVTFSTLAQTVRSIILTSGTLSPTVSFQSELNTAFQHMLNTAHVIPKEQVYVTCVPKGPNKVPLKANYQNVNSWAFQDELGNVLLDVCESVPHGILCFFSSYNVMHTQIDRWKNNLTWSKIMNIKQVFMEPRYQGDLNDIMKEYREVIRETSVKPRGNINGALFLAVFRGKVAEGIDFKDDEARCVVAVGIPYGVRKDPVIDMKLKYNDMNTSRGLLRGSDWYGIQAFRALNQALGRCLRHINDWGAVLLVDERFLLPETRENLSKWVKVMWIKQNGYNLKEELRNFVAKQKARETR